MEEIKLRTNIKNRKRMSEKRGFSICISAVLAVFVVGLALTAIIDAIIKAASNETLTYDKYELIENYMTYDEVAEILNGNRVELIEERTTVWGNVRKIYVWSNEKGTREIRVNFKNDEVSSKEEYNVYDPVIGYIDFAIVCLLAMLTIFVSPIVVSKIIKIEMDEINTNADAQMKSAGFNVAKKYYFREYKKDDKYVKFMAVDYKNKKICFVDYTKESIIITDFESLLNYEVYQNGCEVASGSSIGGGVLLGKNKRFGVGTAFTTTTSRQMCSELRLIIRLNSYENSQVVYNLITDQALNGISTTSDKYSILMTSLQEVVSFIEVIMDEKNKKQNALR